MSRLVYSYLSKMIEWRVIVSLLILVNVTIPIQSRIIQNPDTASMHREIRQVFNDLNMTALGIAVTSDDSIIYTKSFGYKIPPIGNNVGVPLKDDDLFKVASLSKTFIATVIVKYIEEGKLKPSDDAQNYLRFPLRNPAYPDSLITIHQLLTHTSSINDNLSWWNIEVINPNANSEYYKCYSSTAPGAAYKYCNMNYLLLAAVIEGISGKRFDSEVDRIIMSPYNLYGGFNVCLLDTTKFVQLYYIDDNTGEKVLDREAYKPYKYQLVDHYELGKSLGLAYPPSGMKISPKDMARYMLMHAHNGVTKGHRVLKTIASQAMRKNYVGSNNYGWSFRKYNDLIFQKVLDGQTGGIHGCKTCMIFEPNNGHGFVIFAAGAETAFIDGYGDIHKPLIKILHKYLLIDDTDVVRPQQ